MKLRTSSAISTTDSIKSVVSGSESLRARSAATSVAMPWSLDASLETSGVATSGAAATERIGFAGVTAASSTFGGSTFGGSTFGSATAGGSEAFASAAGTSAAGFCASSAANAWTRSSKTMNVPSAPS